MYIRVCVYTHVYIYIYGKSESISHSVMSNFLQPHGLYSPLVSSVHEIVQARTLEWVNIPFSRGSSWPRDQAMASCIAADSLLSEPPGKQSNSDILCCMPETNNMVNQLISV